MKRLLLIGCGGHARSLIDVIETGGQWRIHGLVGLPDEVGRCVLGYTVIGSDAVLPDLLQDCESALLAIGHLAEPAVRQRMAARLENLGFECPIVVSPHAVVSRHAQLGAGTVVGHGAIVNAAVVVGAHCILNSRSLIEHDAHLGAHCHVSTGAIVNGGVRLGSGSFIGSGAILREGLRLPAGTVISAGKRVMGWPLL
jgi:sugar O-acyltransferase (sialic acid O-acetyltransferase NeuD family)